MLLMVLLLHYYCVMMMVRLAWCWCVAEAAAHPHEKKLSNDTMIPAVPESSLLPQSQLRMGRWCAYYRVVVTAAAAAPAANSSWREASRCGGGGREMMALGTNVRSLVPWLLAAADAGRAYYYCYYYCYCYYCDPSSWRGRRRRHRRIVCAR